MYRQFRRTTMLCLSAVMVLPVWASAQETAEPPTIEFVGDRSVEVAQTLGINVFAYSQSDEVPWLWAESLPEGADFIDRGEGFRTFLWYPGADQVGQYTVKFIAADGRDQQIRTEREVVITVTPGTFESQAFSIIAPDKVDAFVGKQLSVVIATTDSNGTVPSLNADWLPDGATLDDNGVGTRSFNWIPTSQQFGEYSIRFSAVSANFPNISTGHDMQIRVIGRDPLISFPVSPGVQAGEVLSFPVRVTKPSGAVPALTVDPLPSNASFIDNGDGSRQFTWATADTDIGTHTFILAALDPVTGLSSTITLFINVLPDLSMATTDQTIMLSSDVLFLELSGATLDEPVDILSGSLSASAGFLANEIELVINGDTTHQVDLLPGINTVALQSIASAQRIVLNIDRSNFPSIVPGSLPAAFAVDVDDRNIVLSANYSPNARPAQNSVDVYTLNEWVVELEAYMGYDTDFSHATSIDISDNTLVAASREAPQAGAWIYERDNTGWQLKTHLSPDFVQHPDGFGSVAALDDDTLAVAAVYDAVASSANPADRSSPGAGAVLIYQRVDGEWQYQTTLKAPVPEFNDYFGSSLALEGDTLVVGAIGEDGSGTGVNGDPLNNGFRDDEAADYSAGAAFVFERVGDEWMQTAYLKPSDNSIPAIGFGHAVSIFEDSIAVSALFAPRTAESEKAVENPNFYGAGAVYVFDRGVDGWLQSQKLEPPANNWRYGLDIDLKKNQLMVLTQARAYFYERHDDQWLLLWDENVGRSVVSFNHEAIVFAAPNLNTLVYRSKRRVYY